MMILDIGLLFGATL